MIPTTERDTLFRLLFEKSADAILILDGDLFVDCNQAAVEMLRYRSKDEFLPLHPSRVSPEVQPDGQPSFAKANTMIATAFAQGNHRFEWWHRRADGEVACRADADDAAAAGADARDLDRQRVDEQLILELEGRAAQRLAVHDDAEVARRTADVSADQVAGS